MFKFSFYLTKISVRILFLFIAFSFFSGLSQPVIAASRIASLNLCTDLLILYLAEKQHIVTVTHLAANPADSPLADRVQDIYLNRGRVEEILSLKPDVIFANSYSRQFAINLLRKLNYPVVEVPTARNFSEIIDNLRLVGRVIDREELAEQAIQQMQTELMQLHNILPPIPTLVYHANGLVSGQGSLINIILTHLGLINLAAQQGIGIWGKMSLETLLISKPKLLIFNDYQPQTPALAKMLFHHPALDIFIQKQQVIHVPSHLWQCGHPLVIKAMQQIVSKLPI